MKSKILPVIAGLLFLSSLSVHAEETLVQSVMNSCKSDIESYCSKVTLGEGRLLACFYAHEDKLSTDCQYGLYKAVATLEEAVNAFKYIAISCEADITKHCGDIQPGEGRVLMCLKEKQKSVSDSCGKALDEVEIE